MAALQNTSKKPSKISFEACCLLQLRTNCVNEAAHVCFESRLPRRNCFQCGGKPLINCVRQFDGKMPSITDEYDRGFVSQAPH